jgi:secreted trypsin-like serine protease
MNDEVSSQQRRLIIGGHDIEKGRYPYFVSIDKNFQGVIVNGALIAPDIVLTAGHVASDHMENLTLKIGPYAVHANETFAEEIKLERFILHPKWDQFAPQMFVHDFLIFKLAEKSTHEPVKINRDPAIPVDGDVVVMLGLGWTDANVLSPAKIVQEAELVSISNEQCGTAKDPFRGLSYAGQIVETVFCTVSPPNTTRDGCAWDSGAPVITAGEHPGDDRLVGLGSTGVGCADKIFPGKSTTYEIGLLRSHFRNLLNFGSSNLYFVYPPQVFRPACRLI